MYNLSHFTSWIAKLIVFAYQLFFAVMKMVNVSSVTLRVDVELNCPRLSYQILARRVACARVDYPPNRAIHKLPTWFISILYVFSFNLILY